MNHIIIAIIILIVIFYIYTQKESYYNIFGDYVEAPFVESEDDNLDSLTIDSNVFYNYPWYPYWWGYYGGSNWGSGSSSNYYYPRRRYGHGGRIGGRSGDRSGRR